VVSTAQVAEYSGSRLDQNSNYLPVGTLSYIPGNLFVRADVLSENVIQKWYKDGHSVRGKILFLDSMKKVIEWLQNAEECEHDSKFRVGLLVRPPMTTVIKRMLASLSVDTYT
jgi:hypothetical protein